MGVRPCRCAFGTAGGRRRATRPRRARRQEFSFVRAEVTHKPSAPTPQRSQAMADIVAEIAEGALGTKAVKNPLDLSEETLNGMVVQEDTDAEVVPDLFELPRRFLTTGEPDFQPTRLVRFGQISAVVGFVIQCLQALHVVSTGITVHHALGEETDAAPDAAAPATLKLLETVVRSVAFLFMLPLPVDMVRAIHPTKGHLALLGAGTQKASQKAVSVLRFWRRCAYVVSVVILAFAASLCVYFPYETYMDWSIDGHNSVQLFWSVCRRTGYAGAVAGVWAGCVFWLLSLKVAAVLAEDGVLEVVRDVTLDSVDSDDEVFYLKVFQPCILLARKRMPILSAGWGRGAAFACLVAWSYSFAKFCRFLNVLHDPDYISEYGQLAPFVRVFIPSLLYAVGPILVIIDLAAVSTLCDRLMNRINLVNAESTSVVQLVEVYRRINPLLKCLKELNTGQGLGFCVYSIVVDTKTLNKLGLAMFSTFATVVPIVLALQPDPQVASKREQVGTECTFTSHQVAVIQAAIGPNLTCSGNMTVNEILQVGS